MRLTASNLACRRGERRLFSGLSFTVAAGDAVLLTGPNGAGKSSLLRLIAGLLPAEDGTISLDGGDEDKSLGEQAHYIAHADATKASLTAEENIAFWAAYYGGDASPREALEAVRLDHVADIPAGLLSAGQKRRLALARLFVAKRPIWLLDEPSVSLDAQARDELTTVMRGHVESGGLLIAATHVSLGLDAVQTLDLGDAAR